LTTDLRTYKTNGVVTDQYLPPDSQASIERNSPLVAVEQMLVVLPTVDTAG
jgi:hypothetical protein